uniref:Uncharacterized protein n=1 Tax=Branchiostoma floridae TaxID=7739 RepID=C3YG66_BRAFL|eukprot:XP_002604576.1 hypothetical protein BRAFLDRAFT_92798 [Branchiostoma floridae]
MVLMIDNIASCRHLGSSWQNVTIASVVERYTAHDIPKINANLDGTALSTVVRDDQIRHNYIPEVRQIYCPAVYEVTDGCPVRGKICAIKQVCVLSYLHRDLFYMYLHRCFPLRTFPDQIRHTSCLVISYQVSILLLSVCWWRRWSLYVYCSNRPVTAGGGDGPGNRPVTPLCTGGDGDGPGNRPITSRADTPVKQDSPYVTMTTPDGASRYIASSGMMDRLWRPSASSFAMATPSRISPQYGGRAMQILLFLRYHMNNYGNTAGPSLGPAMWRLSHGSSMVHIGLKSVKKS